MNILTIITRVPKIFLQKVLKIMFLWIKAFYYILKKISSRKIKLGTITKHITEKNLFSDV